MSGAEEGTERKRIATDPRPISPNQTVSTPRELLDAIELRFGRIVYDLAAHRGNKVCYYFFGDPERLGESDPCMIGLDGLTSEWPETPVKEQVLWPILGPLPCPVYGPTWGWCNPPFKACGAWAEKAYREFQRPRDTARNYMLLVPASVDSNWYREFVEPVAIRLFLNPRITFPPEKNPFPKPMMLALYSADLLEQYRGESRARQWQWKEFLKKAQCKRKESTQCQTS